LLCLQPSMKLTCMDWLFISNVNSDGLFVMLFCKDLLYLQQECSFGYDIVVLSIWLCNC
jgi:hypothetical protein